MHMISVNKLVKSSSILQKMNGFLTILIHNYWLSFSKIKNYMMIWKTLTLTSAKLDGISLSKIMPME